MVYFHIFEEIPKDQKRVFGTLKDQTKELLKAFGQTRQKTRVF